ncbi:MAG TPA: hypothetical protein VGA23_06500 [Methylomirabilota bacterium]
MPTQEAEVAAMGLWAIKYADEHDKWWIDVVLQDAPPAVSREKVGERVVTEGFAEVTGLLIARRTSIPADALEDWPADTPVILTRAELGPDSSLSTSS